MAHIGFLHTSPVHIETFTSLVAGESPESQTTHSVRVEYLDEAIKDGIDPGLISAIESDLQDLRDGGAQVIVCTCSTLGEVAESSSSDVIRIDRPMMNQACARPGHLAVLYALESTKVPTTQLLDTVIEESGFEITYDTHLVEGAWGHFLAGDNDAYLDRIAEHIDSLTAEFSTIILAQSSMARAAQLSSTVTPVYSSAHPAVVSALALAKQSYI